jgi:hypothetical protein
MTFAGMAIDNCRRVAVRTAAAIHPPLNGKTLWAHNRLSPLADPLLPAAIHETSYLGFAGSLHFSP